MRRTPRFHSYDEMLADAEALLAGGYERAGNWNLGQNCSHIAKTMKKSLEGFPDLKPWPFRFAARLLVLGSILKHQQHNRRFPGPAYLMPAENEDDRAGLQELRAIVAKVKAHAGEFQIHPVFGQMSRPQWQDFHLWHAEHHLSFLLPKKAPAVTG
jgi:hypothetical protein